jgi:nucleotide-binding universal stress UspA family protein
MDAIRQPVDAPTMSDDAHPAKTWAIGVHLADNHRGPLRFAATLIMATAQDRGVGIHVMPDPELMRPLVTTEEIGELREQVRLDITEMLADEGLPPERSLVELVEDEVIDRALAERATHLNVSALIVGRRAKRDDDPVVRLGEVTRRLLRRLPAPLIVVPPDFGDIDDRGFGEGPIMVGVDLTDHCTPAVLFASTLAERLDRPLLLVHGTQAFHWGAAYVPTATLDRLQERARDDAANSLREWAAPLGLQNVRHRVFMGDPAKHLLHIAADEDAAVLVTGSRMLGPIERLFLASVSSEVAAGASCPVAVVPGA